MNEKAALEDRVIRAMWGAWRTSPLCPDDLRDLSWDEVCDLDEKHPGKAPGAYRQTAMAEARAAITAIREFA